MFSVHCSLFRVDVTSSRFLHVPIHEPRDGNVDGDVQPRGYKSPSSSHGTGTCSHGGLQPSETDVRP